jgi:D-sedoheptulose 7-phosphate isomerase
MDSLEKHNIKEDAGYQADISSAVVSKTQITPSIYYKKLTDTLKLLDISTIDHATHLIKQTWLARKQIICFGNGGSALTAQHFITDWNKSIFLSSHIPFRGRCLSENMGLITAYANDISYQDIFVEQLKNMLDPGDLVIGISGSGNSENVLRAIAYANEQGHHTIGLCGFDGGKLRQIAKHAIWAPIHDIQISEDIHFTFGHIVMQSLCQSHTNASILPAID